MAQNLVVVIPTAGRQALLHRTLASLAECRKPAIYRKTIVIENGPKEEVKNIVRTFDSTLHTHYMYVSRGNKSYAINKVLEVIEDCLIFFTDDDVRIDPGTLCAYAAAAVDHQTGYFYGGPLEVDYERKPPTWLIQYLPNSARGWKFQVGTEINESELFLGANWAAFAEDLKHIGGFDTNRGPGSPTGSRGMETAAQIQLLRRGAHGQYVPDALVWHYVPKERCSPAWVSQRAYQTGISSGMRIPPRDPVNQKILSPHLANKWMKTGWNMVNEVARGNLHALFGLYIKFRVFCGYIKGCWLAYRIRIAQRQDHS